MTTTPQGHQNPGPQIPGHQTAARYRPPKIAYGIAITVAIVLVAAIAIPVGVMLARGSWPPWAAPGEPAPTSGASGVGDPYFPDYGSSGYDAASYTIAIDFDPGSQTLTGTTVIAAQATQELTSFYLDLALPVQRVLVDDVEATYALEGFQDLKITPATPVRDGQSFSVTVDYAGQPGSVRSDRVDSSPAWRVGEDEWTAFGEPESSVWWFPANDHPSDPALVDVSVRVPRGYQAISVGRLVSADTAQEDDFDTWHWQTSETLPTYASFLAIGRYELKQGESDGRPYVYAVSTRYSAAERAQLFAVMGRTPALVTEIEKIAGPYPYSEIGGVVPGIDMEFGGLETAMRPVYQAGALLDDPSSDALLVHEMAHMWFGDHVTLREWNDIVINEGFAAWVTWAVREQRGGKPANVELNDLYEQVKDEPEFWRITMIDPGPNQLFATVYTRGPMALQAMNNVMGDEAYDAFVRDWAQEGGVRSVEDLMASAQARTSVDLTPLFQEWLIDPDAPERTEANGFR